MTKIIIMVLVLAALVVIMVLNSAKAAPFLTADPYPATAPQPTQFLVKIDGVEVTSPAVDAVPATAGKRLYYDLAAVPFGKHVVTVKASNATATSAESASLSFAVGIATPSGIIIVP